MRTRLGVGVALAGALVALVLPVGAGAVVDDVKGPACADILVSNANRTSVVSYNTTTSTVTPRIALAAPQCSYVTYTVNVYSDASSTTPIASCSIKGTTASEGCTLQESGFADVVQFSFTAVEQDGVVCASMTTSVGGHVFDNAPDTGCIEISGVPASGYH